MVTEEEVGRIVVVRGKVTWEKEYEGLPGPDIALTVDLNDDDSVYDVLDEDWS